MGQHTTLQRPKLHAYLCQQLQGLLQSLEKVFLLLLCHLCRHTVCLLGREEFSDRHPTNQRQCALFVACHACHTAGGQVGLHG